MHTTGGTVLASDDPTATAGPVMATEVGGGEERLVAYCIEPGCRCLDRAGVIISRPEEAPAGYEIRRE